MIENTVNKRKQIIAKLSGAPSDKLDKILDILSKDSGSEERVAEIISFSGSWKDIPEEVFNEFTDKLIITRRKNNRRNEKGIT